METNVYTERQALSDLVKWSLDRPSWQRDALKRIVLQEGDLSSIDIEELTKICLDSSSSFDPLTSDDVKAGIVTGEPVSIVSVENPIGINALAEQQRLEFSKTGLSIVYGDNGSGKSGYARILKHACHTRDGKLDIRGDIKDIEPKAQSANIIFSTGDKETTLNWNPKKSSLPNLSSVSVFDSKSANIHVDETNPIAYTPEPMRILGKLSDICDTIKNNLDNQIALLIKQTPEAIKTPSLNEKTKAGIFLYGLSDKSSLETLTELSTLSEEEKIRLYQLEIDFAQNPKISAEKIERQNKSLVLYKQQFQKLHNAITEESFNRRDSLRQERDNKMKLAKLASEKIFAASPLPDVGKEVWQQLWEAARQYSDQVAYPNKKFPEANADGDFCVLCQQELDEEAVLRRLTFEEFIQGTTKSDETTAITAYKENIIQSKTADISLSTIRDAIAFFEKDLGESKLAKNVRVALITAKWHLRIYMRGLSPQAKAIEIPESRLNEINQSLSKRASQLLADDNTPESIELIREFNELKDRKHLSSIFEDVKKEISRQQEIANIKKTNRTTAKRAVTNKNKELSDKLVTDALKERFYHEVKKINLLGSLPVELRKVKDRNAVSFFQVCFAEKPNEPVGDVFSEGEYRCIALATFLAELVTSSLHSGIIFDDPMSSLDHINRKAVAARLVEESQHRQVIVFTHDLTFLYELKYAAEENGSANVHYQTINRKENRPGYVGGDLPVKAKSAIGVANTLRSEIKTARPNFNNWSNMRRTIFSKGIIEQLREAWDQGIADFIFPVLGRFDNRIKGNSLFNLSSG
ncbi:hypothetical protein BPLS_P5477 [Bathymodiolus platifrons methanotrophic gill symbiont]|uniref:AAA family ATPase n=1 Tax=Bathymodiolus platifrons methanotrophic gill symbiont TaxID=113268 RepID=UPI001B78DA9C|nr:AAA family ATPase [Bathymodiolus platifrons methanotrophic gill symbiont]GFO77190.1 hypothetical protein BPLS_P5477 [Bathymodiolus platifrons methanotrophic gill symbiont]